MRSRDGLLVGVDEAGIGTLAGPMVMACAAYKKSYEFGEDPMFSDSKRVRKATRSLGVCRIMKSMEWGKVIVFPSNIVTELGVWGAWDKGLDMILECCGRDDRVKHVIVDGKFKKFRATLALPFRLEAIPDADADYPFVAAASNLAKDCQIVYMDEIAEEYPEYGFENHHGYATKAHKDALDTHGRTAEHRIDYGDLKKYPILKRDRNKHLNSSIEVFDLKGAPTSYPGEMDVERVRDRQIPDRSFGGPARKAAHHGSQSRHLGPDRHRPTVRFNRPTQR